jgi:hypothetical protein
MNKEKLKTEIETRFPSRRAFVAAFNEAAGFEAIDETVLSRQLSGGRSLSAAWQCAYLFFFSLAKITCKKCGGPCHPGKALKNADLITDPDAAGKSTVFENAGPPVMVEVMKCQGCGHSFRMEKI